MSDIFDYAVNQVIQEEGGFVNDAQDPGGATNMGITLATLSTWRNATCTAADVQALTQEEAEKIYKSLYWDKVQGDSLKPAVALLLFDAAINHGVGMAVKLAQRALRVADDGVIGPQTMRSLNVVDPHDFITDFMAQRALLYVAQPGFSHFGQGWMHRLFDCTLEASGFIHTN